jgi:hypothetical protein
VLQVNDPQFLAKKLCFYCVLFVVEFFFFFVLVLTDSTLAFLFLSDPVLFIILFLLVYVGYDLDAYIIESFCIRYLLVCR